jgi:hypothetical protein
VGPGKAEIRAGTLAPLPGGQVRVRALCGALSRGTESLVCSGRVPPSEYRRMRAPFMVGDFPFPVKYGYATVGRVEAGPESLTGRTVFSLHPHQTLFDIPAEAAIPLPDDVPPARAVLAANMETALNALWDAQPGPADRIAIVGAGVVGSLVAWLCARLPGAEVTLVDIDSSRAALAGALEVKFAAPSDAPRDCDLVVHASGQASGLATAIDLAGDEATILELSWYGEGDVPVPFGGAFHSRRLKLVSSQVGKIAPSHRARWDHRRRLCAALSLLRSPRLDALLAPAIPFERLPGEISRILSPGSGILCQRIVYPD